jgi:hypothetical protein
VSARREALSRLVGSGDTGMGTRWRMKSTNPVIINEVKPPCTVSLWIARFWQ